MDLNLLQILLESVPEIVAIGAAVEAGRRRFRRANLELHAELENLRTAVNANTGAITDHGEAIAAICDHLGGAPSSRASRLTPVKGVPRGKRD